MTFNKGFTTYSPKQVKQDFCNLDKYKSISTTMSKIYVNNFSETEFS